MYRFIPSILIIVASLFGAPAQSIRTDKLILHFFGSSTCGECQSIKNDILKPLSDRYTDNLTVIIHDTGDTATLPVQIRMEDAYGVTHPSPQELFLPDTCLLGFDAIVESADLLVEKLIIDKTRWTVSPASLPKVIAAKATKEPTQPLQTTIITDTAVQNQVSAEALAELPAVPEENALSGSIKKRLNTFTIAGITFAGLADGVNPCAIATLIFLVSFLSTQKRSRKEILGIGLAFTTAVYSTYFLLGLGAFSALTLLQQYHSISQLIRWSAVAFALVIGILSFRDAFIYNKTGKAEDIALQLPKALKKQIHATIRGNITGTRFALGAAVAGFLVTLLEAVCTGQVYLPTIVMMTKVEGFRMKGWLLLAYYNLLFIVPLLAVIILAWFGLKWQKLSEMQQNNMVLVKVILGVVMIAMAAYLGFAG